VLEHLTGHFTKKVSLMKNTGHSTLPATAQAQDSLRILQDVSHIYETSKRARKALAKAARNKGATFQSLGEAMGTDRSSAYALVKDAA
jgi:hypothetical protein